MAIRTAVPLVLVTLLACGGEQAGATASSSATSKSGSATGSARPKAIADASAGSSPASSASASAAATPAEASASASPAPATLATMFDGPPDAAVKLAESRPFGRATLGIPEGWALNNSWDSVDHVAKRDRSAGVVLLRLDISEGLLDANVATWVKVPFATGDVQWEPREPGKVGAGSLVAKVARGRGKIGSDEAEFWQVATGLDKQRYGVVLIAGLKKSADEKTRAELVACVRSLAWK